MATVRRMLRGGSGSEAADRGTPAGRISGRRVPLIDVGANVSSDGPQPDICGRTPDIGARRNRAQTKGDRDITPD